ncbi:MAG: DUF6691 family protein [Byssovorax sp.]
MKLAPLTAFLSGLLFSIGLALSGMTRPDKVRGFLDFTGDWDPSLALVMGGAVGVTLVVFRFVLIRPKPIAAPDFYLPEQRSVDTKLIMGSALFGLGWGIVGYCPGPALLSVVTGHVAPVVFVVAMIVGFAGHRLFEAVLASPGKEEVGESPPA